MKRRPPGVSAGEAVGKAGTGRGAGASLCWRDAVSQGRWVPWLLAAAAARPASVRADRSRRPGGRRPQWRDQSQVASGPVRASHSTATRGGEGGLQPSARGAAAAAPGRPPGVGYRRGPDLAGCPGRLARGLPGRQPAALPARGAGRGTGGHCHGGRCGTAGHPPGCLRSSHVGGGPEPGIGRPEP